MFHEYFGHLPLIAIPQVARISKLFAKAFFTTSKNRREGVGRLWWHAMEWSFIIEDGEEKLFGAGPLAGKKDFESAIKAKKRKFTIEEAFDSPKILNSVQEKYFVHESLSDLENMLEEYVKMQDERKEETGEMIEDEIELFMKNQKSG